MTGFAGGAAVLLLVLLSFRHDEVVSPGVEIHWDDFGFSVQEAHEVSAVGPPDARVSPSGRFIAVRLRVANHAQVVDYDLEAHTPVLEDSEGRRYFGDRIASAAWSSERAAAPLPVSIRPGSTADQLVVFDVPPGATSLRCLVSWGAFGDAVDGLVLGRRACALPIMR